MPLYEYVCMECGHEFDALQSFHDDPIRECPVCKKEEVRKKISKPSFALKGGGWYKDHYGLKESKSAESSEPSKSKDTSSDGDS